PLGGRGLARDHYTRRSGGPRQSRARCAAARPQQSRDAAGLRGRSRCSGGGARRVRRDRGCDGRWSHRVWKIVAHRLPGNEPALSMLVEAGESLAMARSEGVLLTFSEHARALVYTGLGQYESALAPAASASARDELAISVWALPELVEAATRSGRAAVAATA